MCTVPCSTGGTPSLSRYRVGIKYKAIITAKVLWNSASLLKKLECKTLSSELVMLYQNI